MTDAPHRRRALVTGCAGFIGSTLSERLIDDGWEVVGIDSLNAMYSLRTKLANLKRLRGEERFELHTLDLACDPLEAALDGVQCVFHLAARPGVRESFGNGFADYARDNVVGTQRLLEATVSSGAPLDAFVYASSSSVYGTPAVTPTPEGAELAPLSPYGMTKVATEQLAALYHRTSGLPLVGLRYFTVYGPRQRPDMAFSRFIGCALRGEPLKVYGDGRQLRDFTYVGDAVTATLAAAERGRPGSAYNVGGGRPIELADAIALLSEALEMPVTVERHDAARGDARSTCADSSRAQEELGFAPATPLAHGLRAQVEWAIARAGSLAAVADRGVSTPATLRVAMLLQAYRPILGGAQRQVEQLVPLLAQRGIESRVITRRVPGTPPLERAPGTVIERVAVPRSRSGASVAYTLGAARRTRAWRPDLIHAFDLHSPALAALLAGTGRGEVPLVAKILSTGPGGDIDRLRHKALGDVRLRLIARRFSAFQTLSEEVEEELLAAGVPRERLVRVVNGVDTDRFRPAADAAERSAIRAQLDLPADGPLTLYCGRLAPVKRLDLVLEALACAPGHLLLLGEGGELERLRVRAAAPDLAGRVSFRAPVADPAPAYRAADVYISASTTEGMSGSMLEAMASGLPVLAAPASGVRALLGEGAGVIARDALEEELGPLLTDPERRAAIGRRGREVAVHEYALPRTAERLADLYRSLLG